ncbi:hypothetical protein FEM48_Zijuj10G0067900 [Ziziphus jujuba var. spinosa]|uniref:TIR domain-containing protein n=1 Tax=Ziziphus jujuba var. spinosa TaxID=714518 RepID=A0A978ULX8_ZIZJJ|nr:hypothetical protein FEM48_Zijuj10G0067900 [Ziziphus jujuba var. spinosa]
MPSDDVVSAAPGAFRLRWDVFLSFRGEDTRGTITKNIYESLLKHGVRVFLDNDGLNRGDEIAPSLLEAIEDSAACIVVFSPRYADSRWCLEELAKISECRRLILPVFYGVDPSDVRRQRGPFEEHFRIHEERFGVERVLRWRKAMDKVGGIAGFHLWVFRNSEETEKIQSLVKRVLKEINNTPISVAAYTVGIESRGEKPIQGIVLDFAKKSSVKDLSSEAISWNKFRRKPNFNSATNYIKQKCKRPLQEQLEKEEDDNDISSSKSIENMSKLRLLQINHVNYRSGKFKSLPSLKWIQWKGCPLKTLPFHFYPPQLAVAQNLIIMNLRECHAIAAIPDLSGHKKLEKLILENCRRLVKIHKSIGSNMNSLICLNLRGCSNLNELPTDVSGLKKLESLILSGCSKLKQLPQNIGTMKALKKLLLDETAILNLPECIFRLSHLEKLSLNRCEQLKRLPCCIGQLVSLKKLSLNGSGLEELPDSIGSLANLEELSVMWCSSLTILPDSIKNLKSLVEFFVLGSPIEKLPELSVGSLPNLKELSVGKGLYFKELPNSIHYVNSMVGLHINGTSITSLPDQIGELKLLEKLEMRNCRFLTSLPASIGGLTRLITFIIYEADQITGLPESMGMLENLAMLQLTKCKKLIKLPSSIGSLMSLNRLLMEDTGVTELPESFGMLSSLIFLKMSTMRRHMEREVAVEHAVIPTSFSNLSLLNEFYARGCNISGKIADDFEKLSSLEILDLSHNQISCLPSCLRGMSILKKLLLPHCKYLKSLPPLPSSLLELNAANCSALETISDLSNLVRLNQLNLTSCEKVRELPGLECLKSLTRLYMTGCSACSSEVKRILAKGYLMSIRNLSMPGDKIPDWFSQDEVTFSEYKNCAIKGVIIGVVVSLNNQITDEMREEYPAIVDIQAKILKLDYWIYSTTLYLMGVPNTNEEQVHLCRYPPFHPLVSQLKHGYKIQITKRDIPMMNGVELKKSGIYLVYEGDDDYEGDEESLNDNQQSVSEKLAKFFATFSGIN